MIFADGDGGGGGGGGGGGFSDGRSMTLILKQQKIC